MHPHIAARLFNSPLFMHPQKAEVVAWALRDRIAPGAAIEEPRGPDASRFVGSRRREGGGWSLARAAKGVALITVTGSLVNRGAWIDASSGLTSYEGIAAQFDDAARDKEIHSVILDIDSPGGEATGMFGLAQKIREVRKTKRVVAVVNDMAASAAYGIASAADEIVISPTSIVGSIGVVMLHFDHSGELEKEGIRATLIHAGAHKVDGHPFGPLSQEVAADLQRDVMTFYDRFLETVEAGRGARTPASAARATAARTYIGADAIKAGLVDRVATFDQVLAELSRNARPSGRAQSGGLRAEMKGASAGVTRAEHDQAVAAARAEEYAAAYAQGYPQGVKEGRAETVARLCVIMGLKEARGRESMAMAIARTGVSPEKARALLVGSIKAERTAADQRIQQSWRKALANAGVLEDADKSSGRLH